MASQRSAASSRVRRSIRKLTRVLPPPRDEAAVAILRSTKALVRGTPVHAPATAPATAPAPKPVRASTPPMSTVAGRWLRVVADASPAERQVDREPDDAGEAAAVRAGWLLIDAYERLSTKAARQVFGHEIDAWNAYTDDTVANLKSPEGRIMADVEESRVNRLRYRRTMDFAHPGDRVFDVGFGRGYLAAQLIRERGVARYHGIDIVDTWVKASHELLAYNGLADADIVLEAGDLFDLTKEQIAATDANLVVCCEVLEHVDDAELALRVLADALPDGADLLFSVPLHGRLEQVWGHASVFDVARLKQMLDGAGLYAHHVEPLANTWSLVVASRDPARSERVRDASGRPAVRASVPLVNERRFVDVAAADMTPLPGDAATAVAEATGRPGVTCHAEATGGTRFAVESLESLRLAFEFIDCESISRVDVIARAGTEQVTRWSWKPGGKRVATGRRRVWFRPGEASDGFVAAPYGRMHEVDSVEVVVHLPKGTSAVYGLAAAYLP
jgi:2-polyprenyl-3-methyl-5-hydroxy-6-metoxy-1,4-benzoquinol methylase